MVASGRASCNIERPSERLDKPVSARMGTGAKLNITLRKKRHPMIVSKLAAGSVKIGQE